MSQHLILKGEAERIPLPDLSVDLVCGSPPYSDARTYDDGTLPVGRSVSRECREWVDWMLTVTAEALRVTRGPVIWVAAGVTRDRDYWPACEGLMWRWWAEGWGERGQGSHPSGSMYRTCYWHRFGIQGSGGDQWFRADIEYAMCFKRPGTLPWSDNTACGSPVKFGPGGAMSNRLADGRRVSSLPGRSRKVNGEMGHRGRPCHERYIAEGMIANPGNLIKTGASGGGNLASTAHVHENEAPYPVAVPEFFIRSLCPPDGLVLDPFGGSGTTAEAALKHGRNAISLDLRESQCRLARARIERPHAPVPKRPKSDEVHPLFQD